MGNTTYNVTSSVELYGLVISTAEPPRAKSKTNAVLSRLQGVTIKKSAPAKAVRRKRLLGDAEAVKAAVNGKLTVMLVGKDGEMLALTPSALKVLYMLGQKVASARYVYGDRNVSLEVELDAAEMAEAWGWNGSMKEFVRARREDLRALYWVSLTWEGGGAFRDVRLLSELAGSRDGVFTVRIAGGAMHDVFGRGSSLIPAYDEVLAIDTRRHQLAVPVAVKLINQRWANPEREGGFVSVKSLVESCAFPRESALKANRQSTRRYLLEPLLGCLNHLCEVGLLYSWEFAHAKDAPLEPWELDAMLAYDGHSLKPQSWNDVKGLYISYDLAHEAELAAFREKRLEERAKGREDRARRAQAKADREKKGFADEAREYSRERGRLRAREDHKRELEAANGNG